MFYIEKVLRESSGCYIRYLHVFFDWLVSLFSPQTFYLEVTTIIMHLTWELRRLKALVFNTKEKVIKVVSIFVKRMQLFGFVNTNDYSNKERIKELVNVQNACTKKMPEKYVPILNLRISLYEFCCMIGLSLAFGNSW